MAFLVFCNSETQAIEQIHVQACSELPSAHVPEFVLNAMQASWSSSWCSARRGTASTRRCLFSKACGNGKDASGELTRPAGSQQLPCSTLSPRGSAACNLLRCLHVVCSALFNDASVSTPTSCC
jgi:hypothetical protein